MESTDRSLQNSAEQANTTAQTTGANYGSQAAGIGAQLIPQLQAQATGNVGETPTQINSQLVAGQQAAGGATGSVAGEAGLAANRTHNSGALSGVLDQASRNRAMAESSNALGVQNKSADVARANQARSQGELAGIYGGDIHAQLGAMGLQPADINAGVNAGNSGWFQNSMNFLNSLSGNASKAIAATGE